MEFESSWVWNLRRGIQLLDDYGWNIPDAVYKDPRQRDSSPQEVRIRENMMLGKKHPDFASYDGTIKGRRLLDIAATLGLSSAKVEYTDKGRSDHMGIVLEAEISSGELKSDL